MRFVTLRLRHRMRVSDPLIALSKMPDAFVSLAALMDCVDDREISFVPFRLMRVSALRS